MILAQTSPERGTGVGCEVVVVWQILPDGFYAMWRP
jgi:hypothetical protein